MIFILTLIIVLLLQVGSPWAFVLLGAAALVEVAEIVFLRRWSKRLTRRYKPVSPEEALVGLVAEVVTPVAPTDRFASAVRSGRPRVPPARARERRFGSSGSIHSPCSSFRSRRERR